MGASVEKKRRLGIPKCRTPRRPFPRCCAKSRGLLRGHRSAGHTTARGLHADRSWSRGDVGPEAPRAVCTIDGDGADEGARAGASDGGAVVDLIARSETTGRPSAVDAFDAQLTSSKDLLSQIDGHG